MNRIAVHFLVLLLSVIGPSIAACGGGSGGGGGTSQNPTTPTVAVTPASSSITAAQSLSVTIAVSGTGGTPTGSVVLSSGSYISSAATLNSASATITIPAGSLAAGSATLTAKYTPDSGSSSSYNSASGTASVTVTQATSTPTVTVTPASSSISSAQSLGVTITVAGTGATPTGSVVLSSGSYTSSSATLNSGSATITIPAGSLAAGFDTLTAKYTPDTNSSSTYSSASGSANVTVTKALTMATVTVTPEETTHPYAENLIVTTTVKGGSATPTGSVVLSSGSFTSPAVTLNSGSATFYVQPGSLAQGSDTLTVTYTPDSNSSSTYAASTGTVGMTITSPGSTNVTVNIDTLANRHQISPYIYGDQYPELRATSPTCRRGSCALAAMRPPTTTGSSLPTTRAATGSLRTSVSDGARLGCVDAVRRQRRQSHAYHHANAWLGGQGIGPAITIGAFPSRSTDLSARPIPTIPMPVTARSRTARRRDQQRRSTDAYYPLVDTASDCTTGNCLYRNEWASRSVHGLWQRHLQRSLYYDHQLPLL